MSYKIIDFVSQTSQKVSLNVQFNGGNTQYYEVDLPDGTEFVNAYVDHILTQVAERDAEIKAAEAAKETIEIKKNADGTVKVPAKEKADFEASIAVSDVVAELAQPTEDVVG